MIIDSFKNPAQVYRGTDFWMLNGQLSEDEIVRQINGMKEQGIGSFIARTYFGLKSDYPGSDFMKKTELIIKTAKQNGLKVFLQAGYMPEAVPDLPEEYALRYICADNDCDGAVLCENGGKTYRELNSRTFLNMFNRQAVAYYITQSYEKMWKQFESEYEETVISVWVDEPSYNKAYLPWTPELPQLFEKEWGYSLCPKIYMLFDDAEGCETVRYHYWVLMQRLLEKNYFEQIQKWCHENRLMFSGHLMNEDSMEGQIRRACAAMPYYKYFDLPGMDILTTEMNWRYDEIKATDCVYDNMRYNTPIQCVSAAHQAGKKHILCEMYGVTTQNLNFRDQRHLFDNLASHGINHRSIHAMFYSLHGRSKRAFPPHINYYQPYWHKYKCMTDYCARASSFISNGKPIKSILVVHPLETAYCKYRGPIGETETNAALTLLDNKFHSLLTELCSAHLPFELGDINTIAKIGKITDDVKFCIGEMSYDTVVLPYMEVINSETQSLLCEFIERGGNVYVLGCYPKLLDGRPDSELIQSLKSAVFVQDLYELKCSLPKPEYDIVCNNSTFMNVYHTCDGENDYFFIYNDDCRSEIDFELCVSGAKEAFLWNAETGCITPLEVKCCGDSTYVPLRAAEGGSVMVSLSNAASPALPSIKSKEFHIVPVGGQWEVKPTSKNCLLLEFCQYKRGDGEFSPLYPVLAVDGILSREKYDGDITLRFCFNCNCVLHGLMLALEDARLQKISFNGTEVTDITDEYYCARSFEVVRLPQSSVIGENVIEIKRRYRPLSSAKSNLTALFENLGGTELESAYLLGDFIVNAQQEHCTNGTLRFNRNFTLSAAKELVQQKPELTCVGYPFYAGAVCLKNSFTLSKTDRAVLKIDGLHACVADVVLNGRHCGNICFPPYELDVSGYLKEGENTVEITMSNTLRNLLGPYHRVAGEIGECWSGGYGFLNKPWVGYTEDNPKWYEHRETDTEVWTDSYQLLPFGFEQVKFIFRHE